MVYMERELLESPKRSATTKAAIMGTNITHVTARGTDYGDISPNVEQAMSKRRSHKYSRKGLIAERSDDILEHYYLDDHRIGAGAYGHVFSARQKHTGMQVAIKKVLIFEPDQKKRLDTEAAIMKDLDHPHICKLMETYEKGRFMFFVMEYLKGKDVLERMIAMDDHKFSERQAANIVNQTARALHYAHKRGIAHRDIKPENLVFVSEDESNTFVKVVDWGMGSYFNDTNMKSAVGSYAYTAPEILAKKLSRSSQTYTAACDLWSLGIMTYVLLVGHPPFRGEASKLLKLAKEEKLIPEDKTWAALSTESRDLVKGLLQVRPYKRLKFQQVLSHRWFDRQPSLPIPTSVSQNVLRNMRNFCHLSHFVGFCVLAAARQLDAKTLDEVHQVFRQLDSDGDGVLTIEEVHQGFAVLGDPMEMEELQDLFAIIDMDGSGTIDYTEFVAAAVGERIFQEESALMAAFEAFDRDSSGTISEHEIKDLLRRCDAHKVWSANAIDDMAQEAYHHFTSDESIDFDDFRQCIMAHVASRTSGSTDEAPLRSQTSLLVAEQASDYVQPKSWAFRWLPCCGSMKVTEPSRC